MWKKSGAWFFKGMPKSEEKEDEEIIHMAHRRERYGHTRRINIEEKSKVVAAVWGTEFIQFLAALAVFHWDEEYDEFILFFKSS